MPVVKLLAFNVNADAVVTSVVLVEVRAKFVPVATPKTGVTKVGVFAKTKAPVPVSSSIMARSSEEASISVSRRTLPVLAPPVSRTTLPVTSGKVYVLAEVRSAVVMIPAKRPAPPAKGKRLMSSSVAVAERRIKEAVPAVAEKIF